MMKKIFNIAILAFVAFMMSACCDKISPDYNDGPHETLAAPVVKVKNIGTHGFTFFWAPVDHAVQYMYTVKNGETIVASDIITDTIVKVTGLEKSVQYSVSVTAYADIKGAYGPSSAATVATVETKDKIMLQGTITRFGLGDQIDGTLTIEEQDDGTNQYTVDGWYGTGTNKLVFTINSNGYLNITRSVLQNQGYNYYYTGNTTVSCLVGYPGYDYCYAYDSSWNKLTVLDPEQAFSIYITGYYGYYDTGYHKTDAAGYQYWQFDYVP